MKTGKSIIIYFVMMVLITGCTTTEKFTVSAPAGTKITLPMEGIVEPQAGTEGKQKVTIPSEGYCGYVFATPPGSNIKIPMGLNLKRNNHQGLKATCRIGFTLALTGLTGAVGGGLPILILGAATEDDDNILLGAAVEGASAALVGLGLAMGAPAQSRLRQTAYDYSFSYEKNQNLEIPLLSSTLLNPNPEKNASTNYKGSSSTRKKASSGSTSAASSSKGSKVSKSRSSSANKIVGTYTGTGQLLKNKHQEEFYSNINIIVSQEDKNTVTVRIIEDGEDFFEEPLVYTVTTDKKGNYQLKIDKIPEAVITITKSGSLSFTHPKVNIDDTMYNLTIKANKKK